jgi:3-oxoacyl-[acyl-carrier protein] reductase
MTESAQSTNPTSDIPRGCTLVTGGTGAVGEAVVRSLVAQGTPVAFTYRSSDARASALVAELDTSQVRVTCHRMLQEDADDVAGVVQAVANEHGGIQGLVNAAGPHIPMVYMSNVLPGQYATQLDHDANAFFNIVHAAIPHLRASRGSVVAVTTSATVRYAIRDGLSACTKAAVEQLVKAFAVEEGKYGIRVNAVGPGMLTDGVGGRLMETNELDADVVADVTRRTPLRRFASSKDVADAVMFFLSSASSMLTGQKLNVDGGWTL